MRRDKVNLSSSEIMIVLAGREPDGPSYRVQISRQTDLILSAHASGIVEPRAGVSQLDGVNG